MLQVKPDQRECAGRPSGFARFAGARRARDSAERKASNGIRSFVLRVAELATPKLATPKLVALCALILIFLSAETSRAQVSDADKASYADALAYCRGDVVRPMALRNDKRVLCLDGRISATSDISLATGLESGGLFVVRSEGGDIAATIALADTLLAREATVIVNDYCIAVCANYLFMASVKTFVPKDALVAWINHATGPDNCINFFYDKGDLGAPRLQEMPCNFPNLDSRTRELVQLKKKFYKERALSWMEEPPESISVRRILIRMFFKRDKIPDNVYWTWNPRYHARATATNIVYETYPQSQEELDAIAAQLGLTVSVIYDP